MRMPRFKRVYAGVLTHALSFLLPWAVLIALLITPGLHTIILPFTTPAMVQGMPSLTLHAITFAGTLINPHLLTPFYPPSVIAHLADVQERLLTTLILLTTYFLLLRHARQFSPVSLILGLTILLTLTLLASLSFTTFFTTFHLILFPEGNYTFPVDSRIKTLYPDAFFLTLFLTASLATTLFTLTLIRAEWKRKTTA